MRLIDADELMESIRKALGIKSMTKSLLLPAERTIIDQIDSTPTVGGWISVKDRMPELEGDYLVTDGHHVPWKCRLLILAGAKGWANGIYNPLIKYWMPMPELPKEGEVG